MGNRKEIEEPEGPLGVLLVGLGAVSTTFVAGVEAVRRGLGEPIGSLTQLGTIRLGKRTESRVPQIKDFVPLAKLDDLVFGCWDIFEDDCFESASTAGVLKKDLLDQIEDELRKLRPMPAVFERDYVKKLDGPHTKSGKNKLDLAEQLRSDIRAFRDQNGCKRIVMVWCASTEVFIENQDVHSSIESFEKGLVSNDPQIAPSMIYAYAAMKEGVAFANGAPNLTVELGVQPS